MPELTPSNKPQSIVVLSGGQDSVTTFYKALQETQVLAAVHFQYGQRHAVERDCAQYHADKAGVPFTVLDVPAFSQIGDSALLRLGTDIGAAHPALTHLPASFVPGRNLIFLTLAAAVAMKRGATQVWTGVCEADYSGYPDCRSTTMVALEHSISVGMDFPDVELVTPLMRLSKAETFALAQELGVLPEIIEHTHTCYEGDRQHSHEWGYGCGQCPACQVRARGWDEFQAQGLKTGVETLGVYGDPR